MGLAWTSEGRVGGKVQRPKCPKVSGEPKAFQVAKVMSAEGPMEGKGRARAGRALPAVLKHWAFRLRSTGHLPGYKAGRGQSLINLAFQVYGSCFRRRHWRPREKGAGRNENSGRKEREHDF